MHVIHYLSYAGFFTLFICTGLDAQTKKSVAGYEHVYDLNHDGKPSKCDCDYRKKEIVLYSESTFLLEESKGRLDKELWLSETGTWAVEHDSVLVVTVWGAGLLSQKTKQQLTAKPLLLQKQAYWPIQASCGRATVWCVQA